MVSNEKFLAIAMFLVLCSVVSAPNSYGASVTIKGSGDEVTEAVSF